MLNYVNLNLTTIKITGVGIRIILSHQERLALQATRIWICHALQCWYYVNNIINRQFIAVAYYSSQISLC